MPSKTHKGLWISLQELDSAYMGKMEFEVRVEILKQELEFLRCLHDAVSMPLVKNFPSGQEVHTSLEAPGKFPFVCRVVLQSGSSLALHLI